MILSGGFPIEIYIKISKFLIRTFVHCFNNFNNIKIAKLLIRNKLAYLGSISIGNTSIALLW